MTNWQIYKMYKHGDDLGSLSLDRVYRALKSNELQVFVVDATDGKKLYNYVPEIDEFVLVMSGGEQ